MKISVTDKFLWDIYKFLNGAGEAVNFMLQRPTMGNFLPGPKNPIYRKYRSAKNKRRFNNLIYYLKKRGYVSVKNLQGRQGLILTKEGIGRALKASFALEERERRKDGKWVMIIFDIPQNHKKARNLLRSILKNLGYKLLQQSVWVSPYDISKRTEELLQLHYLERYVKIFLIQELSGEI